MYPQIACKRGSIVTLVAFVWLLSTVRLCWENNLAQNWNFSCCSAANTWGQFTLTTETSAAQYAQRQILFLCGKYTCPAKNYNKDDLWKFSSISFSCTAIFKNKILQNLQQRLLLETGLCVSPRFQMCPEDACTRGCKVTLVAFVWLFTAARFLQRQFRPKIETVAV